MSTHEQQTTNNPTSAVRNTGGRNGPQGLEEPMSDENQEEGTEIGIPEAHHHMPVFSKGLRMTDPLHQGPGHGKKEACSIGWEERSQLHLHVSVLVDEVPKQKRTEVEPRRHQQKGTPSRTTSRYSESEDNEGGH
ncbi:hypothetical protein Tco_1223740 [Tanacetum coccineum]